MSHMVIYRSVDGKPGFQQTDDLLSAVEFVERLRNTEGVENARIYRLEQVNFRFQPYYQVHLDQADPPATPRPLVGAPAAAAAGVPQQAVNPAAATMASATPAPPPPAAPEQVAQPMAQMPTQGVPMADSIGDGTDPNDLGNGIRRGLFGR